MHSAAMVYSNMMHPPPLGIYPQYSAPAQPRQGQETSGRQKSQGLAPGRTAVYLCSRALIWLSPSTMMPLARSSWVVTPSPGTRVCEKLPS